MSKLSTLLRQHREQANLSQKKLAKRINFSHTVISRTEKDNGGYIPSDNYLEIFCKELNLSETDKIALYKALSFERVPQQGLFNLISNHFSRTTSILILLLVIAMMFGFWLVTNPIAHAENPLFEASQYGKDILYANDFENGNLSAWRSLNDGQWEIVKYNNSLGLGVQNQNPDFIPNIYLLSSDDWINYSFSTDVIFESGPYEQIYLVVRTAQQPNCSGYRIGGNRLAVSIFRFDDFGYACKGVALAENADHPLISGVPYQLRVDVYKNEIKFFINNELVLYAVDNKYPSGGISLLAYQVKFAQFDNMIVTQLEK